MRQPSKNSNKSYSKKSELLKVPKGEDRKTMIKFENLRISSIKKEGRVWLMKGKLRNLRESSLRRSKWPMMPTTKSNNWKERAKPMMSKSDF